ncbi:hypothetical protein [Phaeacidiphilus oryzae]|uniref:hypothetical protein n=1 Tax=Phaeacidiphilus oryzae TaxID=348818 RepID=UPI00068CA616|nr:hypothetical protein [Phaeacidiphilus oryzae]
MAGVADVGRLGGWSFVDDRGAAVELPRPPRRLVAYVRAGAALWDAGVRSQLVAVYGSGHDGPSADPAKAGALPIGEAPGGEAGSRAGNGAGGDTPVRYLGPGADVSVSALLELRPELVVDVSYDGRGLYALPEPIAAKLASAGVPSVALSVSGDAPLERLLSRFAELGAGIAGAADQGAAAAQPADHIAAPLAAAEAEVREAAAAAGERPAVVAVSATGPDGGYAARPHSWPELHRLSELGVLLPEPPPGPGASWAETTWSAAAEWADRAAVILADTRVNAAPSPSDSPGWTELTSAARVVPWSPETPCSAAAHAAFFRSVAAALRVPQGS